MKFSGSGVSLLFLAAGTAISARDFNPRRRRPLRWKVNRQALRAKRAAAYKGRATQNAFFDVFECQQICEESNEEYGPRIADLQKDIAELLKQGKKLLSDSVLSEAVTSLSNIMIKVSEECAETCNYPFNFEYITSEFVCSMNQCYKSLEEDECAEACRTGPPPDAVDCAFDCFNDLYLGKYDPQIVDFKNDIGELIKQGKNVSNPVLSEAVTSLTNFVNDIKRECEATCHSWDTRFFDDEQVCFGACKETNEKYGPKLEYLKKHVQELIEQGKYDSAQEAHDLHNKLLDEIRPECLEVCDK